MERKQASNPKLPKSLHEILMAMDGDQRNTFGHYLQVPPPFGAPRLARLQQLIELHFFALKPPPATWEEDLATAGISLTQIDKLLSMLHQRLDQFLSWEQLVKSPQHHLPHIIEAYTALKVDFATKEKKWRQLNKKLQAEPGSIGQLRSMIDLEHRAITARIGAGVQAAGSHFTEMHHLLDQHYLLSKLKYCCASLNEAFLLKLAFPTLLVHQVQEVLNRHTAPLPPIIRAYAAVWGLQREPIQDLDRFAAAVTLLEEVAPSVEQEDALDLFNFVLNLCYRHMDVGSPGFDGLAGRIYRILARFGLLAYDGEINTRMFKNVVSIHSRQGLFDWCHTFIAEYKGLLPKEDRVYMPTFCLGLVQYYQGEYLAAVKAFKEVIRFNPEDYFFNLESRTLLLKSYFLRYATLSSSEQEELYKLLDAFRMYVRRNPQMGEFHRKSYLAFTQHFGRLLRHLEEKGGPFPDHLRKAIESEKMITNKAWLLALFEEKT